MKNLLHLLFLLLPFVTQAQSEYQEFKNTGDIKYAEGNYDTAIKNYELALEFISTDGYAKQKIDACTELKLAKECYERGNMSSAEPTFARYTSHAPANYYLGMISKSEEDYDDAISFLESASNAGFRLATVEIPVIEALVNAEEDKELARLAKEELEAELLKIEEAADESSKARAEAEAEVARLKADKLQLEADQADLRSESFQDKAEIERLKIEKSGLEQEKQDLNDLLEKLSDDDDDGVIFIKDQCPEEKGDRLTGCPKKTRFKVELLGGIFVPDYQFGNGSGGSVPIEYVFEDAEESFGNYIDTRYQAGLRFDCFNPYSALNVMWDVKYMAKGFVTTREDFSGINIQEKVSFHSIELPFYFKIHAPLTKRNLEASAKKRKVGRGRIMFLLGAVGSYNFGMEYENESDASANYTGEYLSAVNYGYTGGIGFEGAGKKAGIKISLTYDNYITDLFDAKAGKASISGNDIAGFTYDNQTHYGLNISIRFW